MIDNKNAKKIFNKYVEKYNSENDKIKIKIDHTYRVSELSKEISNAVGEDVELAELIGLLHDIGRFEQVRLYNDFRDSVTIDHAKLGVDILKENDFISEFCPEKKYHEIIFDAIYNHNKLKIDEKLKGETLNQTKIIRDADKIDIMKIMLDLEKKEEDLNKPISDKIYKTAMNCELAIREPSDSVLDRIMINILFIFDINYKISFEIIKKEDYINKMMDKIERKANKERLEEIRLVANQYIERKLY